MSLPDRDELIERYQPDRSRPGLRVNFISSADGAVTLDGRSGGLGNPTDKMLFALLRMFSDAILVGAGTARAEGYGPVRLDENSLRWRRRAGLEAYPQMVLVSGRLDLDPAAALFTEAPRRPIVITHAASDDEQRDALGEVADVLVHGVDRVDMIAALAELRDHYGLGQILCEGGPHLFGTLQHAGLVDELCLTLAPILAGPGAGRITSGQPSVDGPAADVQTMRLASLIEVDGAVFLRYVRR
jgi:riboflavin biosynthesis pyrimidine reductase